MPHPVEELLNDTCWVYIRQSDDEGYVIGITYDIGFRDRETAEGRPPLFMRRFDDTLSAAGYRIVLKALSAEALQEVIRKNEEKSGEDLMPDQK